MKCHCTNNPTVMSYLNKNPECSFNHAQSRASRQSKAQQLRQNSKDRTVEIASKQMAQSWR